MGRFAGMVALLLAVGCAGPVTVQSGGVHQGSVSLNGRAVPLPPGEWRVIGVSGREAQARAAGATTTMGWDRMLLAQEVDGRLAGLVWIQATNRASGVATYSTWEVQACASQPVMIEVIVREGSDRFQNCALVRASGRLGERPANPDAAWLAVYETAARRPGWMPVYTHLASSRVADGTGSLDVSYHFSPETRGFARDERAWAQNGWNPANQDAAKRAHVARVVAWARETHGLVRGGFRSGSTGPAPAL